MKSFESIYRFDVRNNNISYVDLGWLEILKRNENKPLFEVLFADNPICEDSAMKEKINAVDNESCDPLCSKYCYSRNVGGDGYCDTGCNSKECEYDGGDCCGPSVEKKYCTEVHSCVCVRKKEFRGFGEPL